MGGHWQSNVGGTIEGHFWLRGQPVLDKTANNQQINADAVTVDGQKIMPSTIYRYKQTDGTNLVQWFNWLEDAAAILISVEDGTGFAEFHAWVAPASGAAPFEVREIAESSRYSLGNRRIAEVQTRAVDRFCQITGLPVPPDFEAAVANLRGAK